MTEEIKRILDYLINEKAYLHYGIRREKFIELEGKEVKTLLDYITNLQLAIEIKNQRIKEEQQEKERYIKSYNGLNTWNKELQQENEKIKVDNLIIKSANKVVSDNLNNYKSRCEKAIELYKNCKEEDYCILSLNMYEILNGSDEK